METTNCQYCLRDGIPVEENDDGEKVLKSHPRGFKQGPCREGSGAKVGGSVAPEPEEDLLGIGGDDV